MKVFLVYEGNSEVFLGTYSSKFKAFERVFESWLDEEGIDKDTLLNYDDMYYGDEYTNLYHVYRMELDPVSDVVIDVTASETKYSVMLPKEFRDLKIWLVKEGREEKIKTVIED